MEKTMFLTAWRYCTQLGESGITHMLVSCADQEAGSYRSLKSMNTTVFVFCGVGR